MRSTQIPLFAPETEWVAPHELKDLSGAKEVAIDLETYDPHLMTLGSGNVTQKGHIVGVAVAVEGWSGYYPIGHEGGGNMDKKLVLEWVQDLVSQEKTTFIFHNAMYDVCWLRSAGINIRGKIVDTMIAASLIDENRLSYQLNTLAKFYAGIGKDEKILQEAAKSYSVNAKAEMYKLPAQDVGPYAEQDAALTLRLWNHFKLEIVRQELTNIFDLETDLIPMMIDMKWKGVRVDVDHAERIKKDLEKEEKKILKQIKDDTGVSVDVWAAVSVAKAFDAKKIKYQKTEKSGQPKFDKNFLAVSIEEKPDSPKSNYAVTGLYFYPNSVVKVAKTIKPSHRNELEITCLNKDFLQQSMLNVEVLGRGFAWLDTGTHDSLIEASQFVQTVEHRQGYKIACLEEIAYANSWLSKAQLIALAKPLMKSGYGQYLMDLIGD